MAVFPLFDIARRKTPGLKFKEVRESWMREEREKAWMEKPLLSVNLQNIERKKKKGKIM